jgi:serine protease AprX
MKNQVKKIFRIALVAFGVVVFVFAAISPINAAPKLKKSEKLSKKMTQVLPTDFIDVIVKPTATWTNSLTTDLNGRGATLKKGFTNFAFKVYRVKQRDIDAISARSDVDFMTIDDTVKTLGHMTTTTGATGIRNLNGSTNPLDGTGVGIVIVDSGIDASHYSFRDASNVSRVLYSQDFTGENRTDDPYGHGTHVASIAAGNNSVANGQYEGIAPNAKIINLRVLNGTGTGSISGILAALDWIYSNRSNATYNMKVVNLSLGANAVDTYTVDPEMVK